MYSGERFTMQKQNIDSGLNIYLRSLALFLLEVSKSNEKSKGRKKNKK